MTKNFAKHVLAVFMVMIMAVSMFAVVASAETEDIAAEGVELAEIVEEGEDILAPEETGAIVEDETEAEEVPEETEAEAVEETTEETVAETEAETVEETVAETEAEIATPTDAVKNATTPKTGDNMWLFIGIGVIAVALIAFIISAVMKKRAK